jgi:WhiB family transcriptional regulator, redox-sensing transcriptional regulator
MRRPLGHRRAGNAVSLWELLNLGSPDETAWMADGLCAQTDPDAFFPDRGESPRPAKSVCAACPVRAECAAYALERGERFGIWGGLSERERRAIRRRGRAGDLDSEVAA